MSIQRWYVARVKPRAEMSAFTNLTAQGFAVFSPMMKRTIRHARQFRVRHVPIFPGYLFLNFDVKSASWRSVNGTRGVIALITAAGEPVAVPEAVMASLQASFGNGAAMRASSLSTGDTVKFMAGPFADSIGTLASIDAQGRIEVLLGILGTQVIVKTVVSECVPVLVAA
jgi:transcription elongation factor/antiterminator RfaH